MYVGHESRNRDRFGHRRIPDENPRDYYYNHQNVVRLDRNIKDGVKIWPRKHEERDHPHAIDHQKYRSSRTPLDDFGYRSFNHAYQKHPEHHFRSRSRSPFQPWPPHRRREFSDDRRYERRREVDDTMKSLPTNDTKRSSEHRSGYTKHSDYHKMKTNSISKARCNFRNVGKSWGQEFRGESRGRNSRSGPSNVHKKHSPLKSKGLPKSPSKKKSLSRVSSSDFKSSPSTEHLEKQKKYLVDRLAEYERTRRSSPLLPLCNARPKSPLEEEEVKENAPDKKDSFHTSPMHSHASPSLTSLQSFDGKEESHLFNINFPYDEDDCTDDLGDEETPKSFEPLKNPEFVKMIPSSEFKPLFVREEFKRKKEEVLKEEERAILKDYRKNGLKRDSSENQTFNVTQIVTESILSINESQDNLPPKESETLELKRHDVHTVNLPRRFQPRLNQKKIVGEGFDLRQRIHERLQNKQAYEELGSNADKSYSMPSKGCYRRAEQTYDQVPMEHKPAIRRVVSNNRAINLMGSFSNGSSQQSKRSVVLTGARPIATSRFLH